MLKRTVLIAATLCITIPSQNSHAGDPPVALVDSAAGLMADSTHPVVLPGIIVESDRIPMSIWELPAAVTVRSLSDDRSVRYRTPADLAASIPGFRAYPVGNPWGQAFVDVRGFYGGGQSQYLLVSVDGIPLNDISSGMVRFSDVGMGAIDRVEAIRGPVSAQYGDFGLAGVLAMFSGASRLVDGVNVSLIGSSDDGYGGTVTLSRALSSAALFLAGGHRQNDGWREHSRFEQETLFLKASRQNLDGFNWTGVFSYAYTDEELPGALSESDLKVDRVAVARDLMGNPIEDRSKGRQFVLGASGGGSLSKHVYWSGKTYLHTSDIEQVVTTTQSMDHSPLMVAAGAESVFDFDRAWESLPLRTNVGFSVEYGHLSTEYREREVRGLINGGSGRRVVGAVFTKSRYDVSERVSLVVGLRLEEIATRFDFDENALADPSGQTSQSTFCVSPSAALNMSLGRGMNFFASVSRAFKAPTLVHLYDSPPFGMFIPEQGAMQYVLLSNSDLNPMKGVAYEIGLKQHNNRGSFFTASIYHYRLRDEIDFDLGSLRYVNVGRSHHTGVEVAAGGAVVEDLSVEVSGAYTTSIIRSGEHSGNQLSGVPRASYRAEADYRVIPAVNFGLQVSGVAEQYLDGANNRRLDDYAVITAMAGWSVRSLDLIVRIDNLLNREFEYDGYLDPLLMGEARFYPAAPRQVTIGILGGF